MEQPTDLVSLLRDNNTMSVDEINALIKILVAKLPQPKQTPTRAGFRLVKQSSKDCSLHQRELFLGAGSVPLFALSKTYTSGLATYDQAAVSKHGTVVFSSSENISCKQHTPKGTVASDCEHWLHTVLTDGDFSNCFLRKPLSILSKQISMRHREGFNRLPISDSGELLLTSPYYPNKTPTTFYLPAIPWQRYLTVLGVQAFVTKSWLHKTEPKPTLVLKDDFHLFLIPLSVHNDTT